MFVRLFNILCGPLGIRGGLLMTIKQLLKSSSSSSKVIYYPIHCILSYFILFYFINIFIYCTAAVRVLMAKFLAILHRQFGRHLQGLPGSVAAANRTNKPIKVVTSNDVQVSAFTGRPQWCKSVYSQRYVCVKKNRYVYCKVNNIKRVTRCAQSYCVRRCRSS